MGKMHLNPYCIAMDLSQYSGSGYERLKYANVYTKKSCPMQQKEIKYDVELHYILD
jgi:hypothetical protein